MLLLLLAVTLIFTNIHQSETSEDGLQARVPFSAYGPPLAAYRDLREPYEPTFPGLALDWLPVQSEGTRPQSFPPSTVTPPTTPPYPGRTAPPQPASADTHPQSIPPSTIFPPTPRPIPRPTTPPQPASPEIFSGLPQFPHDLPSQPSLPVASPQQTQAQESLPSPPSPPLQLQLPQSQNPPSLPPLTTTFFDAQSVPVQPASPQVVYGAPQNDLSTTPAPHRQTQQQQSPAPPPPAPSVLPLPVYRPPQTPSPAVAYLTLLTSSSSTPSPQPPFTLPPSPYRRQGPQDPLFAAPLLSFASEGPSESSSARPPPPPPPLTRALYP